MIGPSAYQGFWLRKLVLVRSRLPSEGAGGRMPMPTKLIAPSMKTAMDRLSAAWTISASSALGRMCRSRTRPGRAPITSAATT